MSSTEKPAATPAVDVAKEADLSEAGLEQASGGTTPEKPASGFGGFGGGSSGGGGASGSW